MGMTLIGWENTLDTASLSAGSALADSPVTNLQNPIAAYDWRTAGVTASADGAYIDIDAGSASAWRHFLLARTNLTPSAEIQIDLGTSQGASDVYASGALTGIVAGYGQLCHVAAAEYSARYCRISIDDATNPDGNVSLGLVWAGVCWEPPQNPSVGGFGAGREAGSEGTETRGGQEFITNYWQRRIWAMQFDFLREQDVYAELFELDRLSRGNFNALVIPEDDSAYINRQAILGRIRQISRFNYVNSSDRPYSFAFEIAERL